MRLHLRPASSALILFLLLVFSIMTTQEPLNAGQLVIFKSKDYVSRSYEIQRFTDTMNLQAGQDTLPMTMTIYNGSPETPSYKWFRIMMNGEVLATEKDMQGREAASKDVTGLIRGTNLQVQIEAGGVPGANLWWILDTQQMELRYADPHSATVGQEVRIYGSNFPSDPASLTVYFNDKPAQVISAQNNVLVVQVPQQAAQGANRIQVRSGSVTTNPISISVGSLPLPEIVSIDVWMAPPGGTINISGRNFAPSAEQNKVWFSNVPGQVSSATNTSLSVIVPNWPYGPSQLNIPITVESNGMRSAHTYPFDIGPMYHGAVPQFGHD